MPTVSLPILFFFTSLLHESDYTKNTRHDTTQSIYTLSVCLSTFIFINNLSIYLSVCLSFCLSVCFGVSLSVCLSKCIFIINLSIYLSFYLSFCPSVHLSVCPSGCPTFCLYVFVSNCPCTKILFPSNLIIYTRYKTIRVKTRTITNYCFRNLQTFLELIINILL